MIWAFLLRYKLHVYRQDPLRGGGEYMYIEEEAMSLLVFYYCICAFLCYCHSFNPSLCCLSQFLLSYVAVSAHFCLSEYYPDGAS